MENYFVLTSIVTELAPSVNMDSDCKVKAVTHALHSSRVMFVDRMQAHHVGLSWLELPY